MAKRSKQYSFHLNLNNPDHLKIYRTLEDLNTDIHKSVSNFVIKAIIQYINGASKSSLTKSGKNEKENLEGYVTRQELAEANLLLKAEVMKEVAQLFGNAAMNTQHLVTPELMQQMMQMMPDKAKKNEAVGHNEAVETTDVGGNVSIICPGKFRRGVKAYDSIKRNRKCVTYHIEMDVKNHTWNTQIDIGGSKNLSASA